MSKLIKILVVGLTILATLALAGCGEEKKYNEMKGQVVAMEAQLADTKDLTDKGIQKHNAVKKDIEAKLVEMKKLAVSDTKLNNDFIAYQKKITETDNAWQSTKASNETIKKMVENTKNNKFTYKEAFPDISD